MTTLQEIVMNSTLTRFLANIFLFVLVIGSAGVAGIELVQGRTPDLFVVAILSTALGSSIKILGISAGVSFMNNSNKVG